VLCDCDSVPLLLLCSDPLLILANSHHADRANRAAPCQPMIIQAKIRLYTPYVNATHLDTLFLSQFLFFWGPPL
jgi:hypothetical protein